VSDLVIDLFAGGGGASEGIRAALGRDVDIAINHDRVALAVHVANHPETAHLGCDIWEAKPKEVVRGRPVALLWASPDCTHFSNAKGDVPRSKNIRSLAWVVVRWAKEVAPAVIMLENVQEFRGWGPLGDDGKPDKSRMGETFRKWTRALGRLGYVVDHRVLDASHYGAPTRRRRLFVIARRDGQPIVWPAATHGPGLLPFHTAAECIDFDLPCPSIFTRKRPLAEKTMWRIAQGIRRFVLESPSPFILKVNHGRWEPRHESIGEPLSTVTAARRGHAVVTPALIRYQGGQSERYLRRGQELGEPISTADCSNRFGVVAPTLVQTGYGERPDQRARALQLELPLGTVVACGQKHALVSSWLAKHYGDPLRSDGGGGTVLGSDLADPMGVVTTRDHHSLAAVALAKFRGTHENQPASCSPAAPLPTVSSGGIHVAEVRAFLTAYYGNDGTDGQALSEPMRTVTTRHRLGLVTVEGSDYQIVDIGMRMLQPRELLRAQFGRFAEAYDLSAAKTKRDQVRLIGNSAPPEPVEALVRANLPEAEARAA
jgi:DNA (cytosine-5)-methyltransferase 1